MPDKVKSKKRSAGNENEGTLDLKIKRLKAAGKSFVVLSPPNSADEYDSDVESDHPPPRQPSQPLHKNQRKVHPNLQASKSRALGGSSKIPDSLPPLAFVPETLPPPDSPDSPEPTDASDSPSPSPRPLPINLPPLATSQESPANEFGIPPEVSANGPAFIMQYMEWRTNEAKAKIAQAEARNSTPVLRTSGPTAASDSANQINSNVWVRNSTAEVLATNLSKATYICGAGNELPVWNEEDMYAMMKAGLVKEGERVGDTNMVAFDEWYFYKTKEKAKKLKLGGRERLLNKWEAQMGSNKAVSIPSCFFLG